MKAGIQMSIAGVFSLIYCICVIIKEETAQSKYRKEKMQREMNRKAVINLDGSTERTNR